MSKGLEALEIVKTAMLSSGNCLLNSLWDYTDVIEKELKSLDNMRLLLLSYGVDGNEKLEKELKALEIIKKEPFISANWYLEGTYEEYVDVIETVKITEDEWNIVKEALS